MQGAKFPQAQFLITGVLGPRSNAHGPNEFLHIPTGEKVTEVVALVLADHFVQGKTASFSDKKPGLIGKLFGKR
jgi:hypothetical protein